MTKFAGNLKHIKYKQSHSISVLAKTKHVLDLQSLHILYNSLILPYLDYCTEAWGKTSLQPHSAKESNHNNP